MPRDASLPPSTDAARPVTAAKLPPRARRGPPEETRQRLLAAAAQIFNRDGYDGTDSNRIARAAGYAPGTFYKHFADKREIFLAVYAEWVAREWRDIAAVILRARTPAERAQRIVDLLLEHHRRWRGFRVGLRALVTSDPDIRAFYRAQRRVQLRFLHDLERGLGGHASTREEDALLLFTFERVADALADGEAAALGLRRDALRRLLMALVRPRVAAP